MDLIIFLIKSDCVFIFIQGRFTKRPPLFFNITLITFTQLHTLTPPRAATVRFVTTEQSWFRALLRAKHCGVDKGRLISTLALCKANL